MQVTNRAITEQSFNLKDGSTVTLQPGESRNIALADPDSVENVARQQVGTVIFGKPEANSGPEPDPSAAAEAGKVEDKKA